jgi:hypothetical protein
MTGMKYLIVLFLVLFVSAIQSQPKDKRFSESFSVSVKNSLNRARENVMVLISDVELKSVVGFNAAAFIVVVDGKEIPAQYNTKDVGTGICFVLDKVGANEAVDVKIKYRRDGVIKQNYPKRTQAELSFKSGGEWKNREYIGGNFKNTDYLFVPPQHKDHSWFIRYEGPGWESDKVGYRFYLDQRNATDVFGKITTDMVLQQVGQDGFDSYHEMQIWGMDVMKVGKSLGLGSIGFLDNGKAIRVEKTDSVNCHISENGPVYSSVLTNYKGWNLGSVKTDLSSVLSIHAGTRLTHQQLQLNQTVPNICTGIVKDANAALLTSRGEKGKFGYVATYGAQSLNKDELGLVVFFPAANLLDFSSDEFSHVVALKHEAGKIDYYFAAAWVKEKNGITSKAAFEKYINETAEELANPVQVKITSKGKSK